MRQDDYDALRQGMQSWADYVLARRKTDPNWTADLKGANLKGVDLTGAKLNGADLTGANLEGANLTAADMLNGELARATLGGATLIGAILVSADFTDANLTHANMYGALLIRASLVRAILQGAILVDANLEGAILIDANLEGAILTNANLKDTIRTDEEMPDAPWLEIAGETSSVLVPDVGKRVFKLIRSPHELEPVTGRGVRVRLSTEVGPRAAPQEVAQLMSAVATVALLASSVGARLQRSEELDDPGGDPSRPAVLTAGAGNEIYLAGVLYRNPFVVDLVEVLHALPTIAATAGGGLVVKDLLKGRDRSGLVSFIMLLMSPRERAAFSDARVTHLEKQQAEDRAVIAEAEARARSAAATAITVAPSTNQEIEQRVFEAGLNGADSQEIVSSIPQMAALTRRGYTVVAEIDETLVAPGSSK